MEEKHQKLDAEQGQEPQSRPGSKEQELRTSKENFKQKNQLLVLMKQHEEPGKITPTQQQQEQKKKPFFTDTDKLSRLEQYEEQDQHDELNQHFIPFEGFKGPKSVRISTDPYWIIPFFLIYIVFGTYTYFALADGRLTRLSNGMDFRGELCGQGTLAQKPFLYWASPQIDFNVAWCVRQCPPNSNSQICIYDVDHFSPTIFCYLQMQTDQMGRYCIPKEPQNRAVVLEQLGTPRNIIKSIASDLFLCWDLILVFIGASICLSYLFTVMASCKSVVTPLIWGGVWGSVASFGVFAWLCWLEADRTRRFRCIDGVDQTTCGGLKQFVFEVLAFIIGGFGALYLIVILCLFTKINRGIQLIKKAQHMIQVLTQIRWFPFLVTFVGLLFSTCVFTVIVNSMTVGNIKLIDAQNIDGNQVWKFFPSDQIQYLIIFGLFTLIFTMVLTLVMNDMFTTYALSVWYFTKQKDTVEIPMFFVIKQLYKYHFGTCVFITFNMIFLTVPQLLMNYVRFLLRVLPQTSNCVRYTQACCMGCLHVYETFLRYISKHTVVQVAVWSMPYYTCAKRAYFLLFRNANKVKDLDFLQALVVFQLQLCTSLAAAIPVYIYINYLENTPYGNNTNEIETPIIPTAFIFILGLFFTSIFQGSYDITCKTIIQLYLMDCEMFYGEQRYVEPFIRDFMEFIGKQVDQAYLPKLFKEIDPQAKSDNSGSGSDSGSGSESGSQSESDSRSDKGSEEEDGDDEEGESEHSALYGKKKITNNNEGFSEGVRPTNPQRNIDQEELNSVQLSSNNSKPLLNGTLNSLSQANNTQTQVVQIQPYQKLNTSQQSFQHLHVPGDISNISDVSVGEGNKQNQRQKLRF